MANFVIVGSDYSGFGSKTIKVKPSSVNTSNITEKKGKLVIKVNGEVQRTISLSQAVKASTPETPGTVTLISREISLELKEMSTTSLNAELKEMSITSLNAEFKEVDTNSASQPLTKPHTINKNFTSNRSNKTSRARVQYSVHGIQTDYFSDGSNVKTYLYPDMSPNSDDQNWTISYPNKPGGDTLLISQLLDITSVLVLGSLPTSSRLQFTFTLNDVKTSKANVSYGMTLKVPCTLVITVKTLDVHIPIIPSNPDLKPIDPDIDPQSDDPTYDYGN